MRSPRANLFIQRVAANVARLRVAKGLTQERLAEVAEIAPRSIQRIERAAQDLSISALVSVADALAVHPSALLKPARLAPARPGRPAGRKPGASRR